MPVTPVAVAEGVMPDSASELRDVSPASGSVPEVSSSPLVSVESSPFNAAVSDAAWAPASAAAKFDDDAAVPEPELNPAPPDAADDAALPGSWICC